jgi:hypothetical protein
MTRLIEANLPLYIRSLAIPTEWHLGRPRVEQSDLDLLGELLQLPSRDPENDLLVPRQIRGEAADFDPWEKRIDFFRLKRGDTKALLEFLRSVGLFEPAPEVTDGVEKDSLEEAFCKGRDGLSYGVRYLPELSAKYIWDTRDLFVRTLKANGDAGKHSDFQVRLLRKNGKPQVVFTTTTFLDAILLTLSIDRIEGAKVRKCARPDCGVPFSITGGHKRKYCAWYCGHIESVRKQRRKTKIEGRDRQQEKRRLLGKVR